MKTRIFLFLLVLTLIACDKTENKTQNGIQDYPTVVGSTWQYKYEAILNAVDTNDPYFLGIPDTQIWIVDVWVDKDTLFYDTVSTHKFMAKMDDSDEMMSHYMFKDDDGLKCFAYSNVGATPTILKGASFKPAIPSPFMNFHDLQIPVEKAPIYFETPPTLNVKLPLLSNSEWRFRDPSDDLYWQIDKRVIGYELLTLEGRTFLCYRIEYDYADHEAFENLRVTDWVSKEGLVKREVKSHLIFSYIIDGNEPVEFSNAEMTFILSLIDVNLKAEI